MGDEITLGLAMEVQDCWGCLFCKVIEGHMLSSALPHTHNLEGALMMTSILSSWFSPAPSPAADTLTVCMFCSFVVSAWKKGLPQTHFLAF